MIESRDLNREKGVWEIQMNLSRVECFLKGLGSGRRGLFLTCAFNSLMKSSKLKPPIVSNV